jgi:hypothetical protein
MTKGVFIKGDVVESEAKPKVGSGSNAQQIEAENETPKKEKDSTFGQIVHSEETVRKTS